MGTEYATLDHLREHIGDGSSLVSTDGVGIAVRRTLAPLAFLPPHSANRHDAGGRGAGVDRRCAKMASGLSNHAWTIKELFEAAAEV